MPPIKDVPSVQVNEELKGAVEDVNEDEEDDEEESDGDTEVLVYCLIQSRALTDRSKQLCCGINP